MSADLVDSQIEELCALDDPESRKARLRESPELATAERVAQLAEMVRQCVRVDVGRALRAGETAVAIAETLGEPESLGRALRAHANGLWFNAQCGRAADLLERAEAFFEKAEKTDEVGRTLSTSIQPLILLGEYEQALRNANKARAIFSSLGDDLRLARLELNVANIHHRQERYGEAYASYERAYEKLLTYQDAEAIAVALHNMAVCLIGLDEFERALETYRKARAFFNAHDMPLLVLQADYNIAYLDYLRGDYERALSNLGATRESCLASGDAYHAALCDLDQSEIYLELNLAAEAVQIAERASAQFERLGMGYELGRSLTNLGIGTSRKRETARAVEIFARAKTVFIQEGHKAGAALVDLYQAVLLSEMQRAGEAKSLCASAREFFGGSGLKRKAIVCDLLLSDLARAEGDFALARQCCRRAFAQLKGLQAPVLTFQAHFLAGCIHESSGRRNLSAQAYQAALRELETVRSSLQGEELRITFSSNKVEVYERLIRQCLERGPAGAAAEEAFDYIERARCRSLMDSMFGRAQPLATRAEAAGSGVDAGNLRAQLNWYYHRIELEEIKREGAPSERLESLRGQARTCEDELLRVLRSSPGIPDGNERPRGTRYAATVALPEIRAALDSTSALVEYFQVGEELMAAVLTEARLEVVPLGRATAVKNRLRMLEFQLSKFRLGPDYTRKLENTLMAATRLHLRELYNYLFAPIRHLLRTSHLVLVPSGFLHYAPLHALDDGERHVIDQFTVSYAPSASIYAMLRQTPAASGGRSLILGVHDERTPGILREVEEVAAVLPNSLLLTGAQASTKALQEWGPGSRLIHIATHGFFRTDNPMFSAVRLGDSDLNLYDLYNVQLPVELLTLSGCATGLNVVAAGDELLGLSRGLLYAGAQTLLLTLWDVHDGSTAEFMRSFYVHLAKGISKAAALRIAILELRERYPHPWHWAPFTLVGKAP